MTSTFDVPEEEDPTRPAIVRVIGVGGGGGNVVERMIQARVRGVEFIVADTDAQALRKSTCHTKIHIGKNGTQSQDSSSHQCGWKLSREDRALIKSKLDHSELVFVVCGLGGCTGSAVAPMIAKIAKKSGACTVGVATMPYKFEGRARMREAESAIKRFRASANALVDIKPERLIQASDARGSHGDVYRLADDMQFTCVRGIEEIVLIPSTICVDWNDLREILIIGGNARMGVGMGQGSNRAIDAAKQAMQSLQLDGGVLASATGAIVSFTGGADFSLAEIYAAMELITEACDEDCDFIYGLVFDDKPHIKGCHITLVATGLVNGKDEDKISCDESVSMTSAPDHQKHEQRHGRAPTKQDEAVEENRLFPGRPNYTGLTMGWFGMLQLGSICEETQDVLDHVDRLRQCEPSPETTLQLHHLIYLDPLLVPGVASLDAVYDARRALLYRDYSTNRDLLDAEYNPKIAALSVAYQEEKERLDADYQATYAKLDEELADYSFIEQMAPITEEYKARLAKLDADDAAAREPLEADHAAKRTAHFTDYKSKLAALDEEYKVKRDRLNAEVVTFIRSQVPNCNWDGKRWVFQER